MPILLIISVLSANAQQDLKDQRAEVKTVIIKFFDNFSTVDTSIVRQTCTKTMILLENGKIWNVGTIINKFLKMQHPKSKRLNEIKFIDVQVNGNTAWVSYYNTAHLSSGDQKQDFNWLESAVLVKQDDKWLIALLHSTVVKVDGK